MLHELEKLKLKLNIAVSSIQQVHQKLSSAKRSASAIEDHDDAAEDEEGYGARAVSLGSRKQLCIHERLREKASDLDEACRQMLGGRHLYFLSFDVYSPYLQRRARNGVRIYQQ